MKLVLDPLSPSGVSVANDPVTIINGGGETYNPTSDTIHVVGPSSATDNAVARYDTTTGKLIQNSGVTISDNNAVLVQAGTSTTVPLTAKAAASQSADIIQVQDSSATVMTKITANGDVSIIPKTDASLASGVPSLYVETPDRSGAIYGPHFKMTTASDIVWAFRVSDSTSTLLFDVNPNGTVTFGTNATFRGGANISSPNGDGTLRFTSIGGQSFIFNGGAFSHTGGAITLTNNEANGSAPNLFRGDFLSDVTHSVSYGIRLRNNVTASARTFFEVRPWGSTVITLSDAATIGLVIKATASQTADLLQIQKSDGTIYTSFDSLGKLVFGPSGSQDTNLYRSAANVLATDDDVSLKTAGKGLQIKEGSNARMGTATLVGGTVTVNNTSVTANTRIFLTVQSLGTVTVPTAIAVTARTAATSFTITSADATDTSVIAYQLIEPS